VYPATDTYIVEAAFRTVKLIAEFAELAIGTGRVTIAPPSAGAPT
jgi:hypothetical protein